MLALALCTFGAGCAEREQKFDIVPGPIGIHALWSAPGGCSIERDAWSCIDELLAGYRRDYREVIRRDATLVDAFREAKRGDWRRNTVLMERLLSRQTSLLRSIEQLDDGFFAALPRCGVDATLAARRRVDRRIEVRRAVIEGTGPAVLDLRLLLDPFAPIEPAVDSVLAQYAEQLADLLLPLQEAERWRLVRLRKALEGLEAEAAARGERRSEEAEQARARAANEEASVPIRRSLARVMELNLATLERLHSVLSADQDAALAASFRAVTGAAAGGTGGDPSVEWIVEVASEIEGLPPDLRTTIRDRLERFRTQDAVVAQSLLESMRAGRTIPPGDARHVRRDELRKELIAGALAPLTKEQREKLDSIRNLDDTQKGVVVMTLAPSVAARLMARMPASMRVDPPEPEGIPDRPDEMALVFLPPPADEAWLAQSLDRLELPLEQRTIAEQLWRDDALAALRALAPLHEATKAAESEIGRSLSDPTSARRAIDAYFSAIDRERDVVAVAEERYLDSVASLVPVHERDRVQRLRQERRLARERIHWRFMPFGDGLGFGPEASVTAVDALSRAELEPEERAIAEAMLDSKLEALVEGDRSFRAEGLGAIRRLVVAYANGGDRRNGDERLREALPSIAATVKHSVSQRQGAHLEEVAAMASALGLRGVALRAAWRRAAMPEHFTDDALVRDACTAAQTRTRDDEALASRVRERIQRFESELDAVEEEMMEGRRMVRLDGPARRRDEVQSQLRECSVLAMAVAFRRDAISRLLRDLACMTDDPALRAVADAWMRPKPNRTSWIYE